MQRHIDTSEEENKKVYDEEENEVDLDQNVADSLDSSADEAKQLVELIFDPTQREIAYLKEFDQEVVSIDVPERIQLNYVRL